MQKVKGKVNSEKHKYKSGCVNLSSPSPEDVKSKFKSIDHMSQKTKLCRGGPTCGLVTGEGKRRGSHKLKFRADKLQERLHDLW